MVEVVVELVLVDVVLVRGDELLVVEEVVFVVVVVVVVVVDVFVDVEVVVEDRVVEPELPLQVKGLGPGMV